MTKTEKAIIDLVNNKCTQLNTKYIWKSEFARCISEITKHNPNTIIGSMAKQKLIIYSRNKSSLRLANGLMPDFNPRTSKNSKDVELYLDYHADELLEKLTEVLAYQNRVEITEFFNKYYAMPDLIGAMNTSSNEILPDITPEEVDIRYVRIWLYKMYHTCYKMCSKYKEMPEAYKEAATSMQTRKSQYGYYVLFDMTSCIYNGCENTNHLTLPHARYFDSMEDAEAFAKLLQTNNFRCNVEFTPGYNLTGCTKWNYSPINVVEADKVKEIDVTLSCCHRLPCEIVDDPTVHSYCM